MAESKQWRIAGRRDGLINIQDEHGLPVANAFHEDNARLIASAPDLLYALKGILEGDSPNWTDIARAAIEKAEGK